VGTGGNEAECSALQCMMAVAPLLAAAGEDFSKEDLNWPFSQSSFCWT
jgi:hypothetical protein